MALFLNVGDQRFELDMQTDKATPLAQHHPLINKPLRGYISSSRATYAQFPTSGRLNPRARNLGPYIALGKHYSRRAR